MSTLTTMTKWIAALSVVAAIPANANPESSTDAMATADREFAFDLAKRISPDDNAVFSPASIQLALGMTYAGARGATATQLQRALHFDRSLDMHAQAAALLASLASLQHDDQAFRIANRLYAQSRYPWSKAFLDLTAKDYGAGLEPLDFTTDPDGGRKKINAWIEEQTNKKIMNLLPPGSISGDTRMVLADAVYFKGKWLHPFETNATRPQEFFARGKTSVNVPMMMENEQLKVGGGGDARILELPYSHGDIAMDIILPSSKTGLASVEAKLNGAALTKLIASMKFAEVNVTMPKFQVRSTVSLKDVLEALGVRKLFAHDADLSGMVDKVLEPLFVDEVYHQGFVAVDENGTEAAAATAVVVATEGAIAINKTETFRVDHPFVWMIRDLKTGEILFYGRVVDPR
jgi:serpin B